MLLQGFSNHLGRQAGLHIPEALDRVITILDLRLVLILERLLGELFLKLRSLKVALQFVALLFNALTASVIASFCATSMASSLAFSP